MKLKLVKKIKIKKLDFSDCYTPKTKCPKYCYLCKDFNDIEKRDLEKFIRSKILYIYRRVEFPDINRSKKCPWCEKSFDNLEEHIKKHRVKFKNSVYRKSLISWQKYKIQLELYDVLVKEYLRKGGWDSFGLLPGGCELCVNTRRLWDGEKNVEPRRCVLVTSPKNRMRCLSAFGINVNKLGLKGKCWQYGMILG